MNTFFGEDPMKRLAIPLTILLALSFILTACTSSPAQAPFVYGVWADYDASLSSVMRVNQDGQNPTTLAEDSNGIFLFQLVTYHNYAAPLSPDGQYLALYLKDTAGIWSLNIIPTTSNAPAPIYIRQFTDTLQRFMEGFSSTSRFYAYTVIDSTTNMISVEVADLQEGVTLTPLENTFFVDYLPGQEAMLTLAIGEDGSITAVQSISLPDLTATTLYEPTAEQQLGLVSVSPDGTYLLVYDLADYSLTRVPLDGSEPDLIFTFGGTGNAANYDPSGQNLVLIETTDTSAAFHLMNTELTETLAVDSIASTWLSFSSDGGMVTYQDQTEDGAYRLNVVSTQGGDPVMISTDGQFYKSQFTPDDQNIVYIQFLASTDKVGDLFVASLDGTSIQQIDTNVTSFDFDADGNLVYFRVDTALMTTSLVRSNLDGSAQTVLMADQPGVLSLIR
jgi:dipeptidyl aminopeptidase/acylaminoacyl peptidase